MQQYAAVYEACLHHLLFTVAVDTPVVAALTEYEALTERALPGHIMDRIRQLHAEDADQIVGAVQRTRTTDESKVRFDAKVDAALELGIITGPDLAAELKEFYAHRNLIHLHAELSRHDGNWDVELARQSYRRIEPFTAQCREWVRARATPDLSA